MCVCVGGGGDRPLEKCRGIFCLYDIFLTPSSLQDFFDSSWYFIFDVYPMQEFFCFKSFFLA